MRRRLKKGATAVEVAIEAIGWDDAGELRALLDSGLDPGAADPSGAPLLFFAATGSLACCLLLMERGANLAQACPDGTTAAMRAARSCPECLSALGADGSLWGQIDDYGHNVLHHGSMGGTSHATLSLAWAARNAPCRLFHARNKAGETPLEMACRRDSPDALRLLLPRSEASERNPETGLSPLEACLEEGRGLCAAILWKLNRMELSADFGEAAIARAWDCRRRHASLEPLGALIAEAERALLDRQTEAGGSGAGSGSGSRSL